MGDGWFNLAGGSRGSEQWSEGIHFQRVQLGSLNDRSQSRNQARPIRVQVQGDWMLSAPCFSEDL